MQLGVLTCLWVIEREIESARKFLNQLRFNPNLLNTYQILLLLGHWAHGRGAADKLSYTSIVFVWRPQPYSS